MIQYYKEINGEKEFYKEPLIVGDMQIFNASHDMILSQGWMVYENVDTSGTDILDEIARLKSLLQESDYKAIKYSEGWMTEEEYYPIKMERQSIREQINELEESMNNPTEQEDEIE